MNSDRGSLGLAGEHFPVPDHLTEAERTVVDEARAAWQAERGYLDLQSHRPDTIATAAPQGRVRRIGR